MQSISQLRLLLLSATKHGHYNFNFETLTCSSIRLKHAAAGELKAQNYEIQNYNDGQSFSKIPGPPSFFGIANWLGYKRHPERIHQRHRYMQQLQAQYGDIVKETLPGNKTIVHLLSPNNMRQVYNNEGKFPSIPPLLPHVQYYRKERQMAPGLGNCNGEEWYNLRAVVQQILVRPQKAFDCLYLQNEVADEFVDRLESLTKENGELIENLHRWIYRWGLESSFNTFFEMRKGFLRESGWAEADEIITRNANVFELSTKLFFSLPIFKHLPNPTLSKLFENEDYINGNTRRYFEEATKEFKDEIEGKTQSGKKYLFLSYLLGNKGISAKEAQSVVNSVLVDTLSTTSQALIANIYTLARHPEAQEKAYQEAMTKLPESGYLNVSGFNSCTYIKGFIKETFRFLPVGLDVQRHCPSDMVIDGYQVPEGTYLNLVHYVPLHDEAYIPNPELFIPERWVRGHESFMKLHPLISIPFSVGTRMCAGRRFAEQELVMLIAKILRRFRLEWHDGNYNHRFRILQVPDYRANVKFIAREN